MPPSKRPRHTFTPEFKHQLVQLYKNGKRKSEITKEYDVGYSTLDKWIAQEANSGSFKEKIIQLQSNRSWQNSENKASNC